MNYIKKKTIYKEIASKKCRYAWGKGVQDYAEILLDYYDLDYLPTDSRKLEDALLNGAMDWNEYSYGGCALIYDGDIARTLCSKSELLRTDYGRKNPNRKETWLDVQSRALYQAFRMIASEVQRYS